MKNKLLTIIVTILTTFSMTAFGVSNVSATPHPTAFYAVSAMGQKSLGQCKVTKANADFFIEASEKTIKIKKGTLLNMLDAPMHQGFIVVKAKIGKKWLRGEIKYELTDC